MRDRPIPKLVRLDPGGAYVSNAMFEVITGLNLDVQVTPQEALLALERARQTCSSWCSDGHRCTTWAREKRVRVQSV